MAAKALTGIDVFPIFNVPTQLARLAAGASDRVVSGCANIRFVAMDVFPFVITCESGCTLVGSYRRWCVMGPMPNI
jgi:hypothetical protein